MMVLMSAGPVDALIGKRLKYPRMVNGTHSARNGVKVSAGRGVDMVFVVLIGCNNLTRL